MTETWLSVGESRAFTELLPHDCSYFNSPWTSGRGGGIVTVYKIHYKCKQLLLSSSFTSFELSLFELGRSHTVLCAVVYRPPKYNKDFLNNFSDYLAEIMPKYDSVLIVGDFNVHVCCPDKPMAKDFLNLIILILYNLCLDPLKSTDTHLTLFYHMVCPLLIKDKKICDSVFSDHMPVLFEAALARRCCIINPSTAFQSSVAFSQNSIIPESVCSTEELSSWFHSTCQTVLDTVAPLKSRQPKTKSEPWLNDTTHAVRRECRRAERKWKKDKLQVSLQMLRDCWRHYQKTVQDAKRKHFSDIILSNHHKPCVLFDTIDFLLNTPQTACMEASPAVCENFLHFFIDKFASIWAQISPTAYDPSIYVPGSAVFD